MTAGNHHIRRQPSPTQAPSHMARHQHGGMHERAVVTVTSVAGSDSTSAANGSTSSGNRIPIGPIVGGILAGVAVVCLIGGTWWYCAMKKEKEREARRRRKARGRAGTGTSRPSIATRPSATSLASMNKPSSGMRHDEKIPPVPAIPASAYTMPYVPPGQGHHAQYQQQQHQQQQYQQAYQYQQPQYQAYQQEQVYTHTQQQPYQQQMQQAPPVLAPPIDVSAGSAQSSAEPSAAPARDEKPSRSAKSRMRNLREAAPANNDPNSRYTPNKPSPLAAAGRVAQEKKAADSGPQWGQGPFRSMSGDSQDGQSGGRTEHLTSPGREPTSPTAYTGQAMLSPTQSGFSAASASSTGREPSGEWGVAYSASGDNRYRQPVDSQTYQAEPIRPQPARSAMQYDTTHRSPPRQGGNGGDGEGAMPGQAACAYGQAMDTRAQDPYAQAALRAVSPVADPYLPASPGGRMYGRV